MLLVGACFAVHVQDNVIAVGWVSLTTIGWAGAGGRSDGFVRWKAMFGFVGDSTDSAPVAEVSPDAPDATQVYWPESVLRRSVTKIRPFNST